MTEYIARDYRISALPFDHEEGSSFTLILAERPNGQYVVLDRFNAHLTKDGRMLPKWFTYHRVDIDSFERLCYMDKVEAFMLAKQHLPKMMVNGITAENVKEMEQIKPEEWDDYRRNLISSRPDDFIQQQKDRVIHTEEEFLDAAA